MEIFMPDPVRSRRFLLLNALALFVAGLFSASYVVIAIARVVYPYDLDFLEGGILMQAWQGAQGLPVYSPPNADFVPLNYMPLYTWLGGLFFKLSGPGLMPLRLLSLASTLTTAVLIYWIAQRESESRAIGLLCAALFLAGYRIIGGWYELARVDALFVMLALAGSALTIYYQKWHWGVAGAGLLMALCLLTKQQGAFFAIMAGGYLLLVIGRRIWIYAVVVLIAAGLPMALLQLSSHGWFWVYVYEMSFDDPREWQRLLAVIGLELFGSMAALTLIYLATLALIFRRRGWQVILERPWLLFIAGAIFVAAATRLSVGAARNTLMPAYTFLCLAPALLAAELAPLSTAWRRLSGQLLLVVILIQFALTVVNPLRLVLGLALPIRYLPTVEMRVAGDRLIGRLEESDGEVLVMMHPYYAILAGKKPGVHISSLWHARYRGRDPLPADLVQRIQTHYYAAIISDESLDFEMEPELQALIRANYRVGETLVPSDAPPTLTGVVVRPMIVHVPRS
jgi:4-amino-4-deoxy-L-arabinose transferase-like glycosyltransferase